VSLTDVLTSNCPGTVVRARSSPPLLPVVNIAHGGFSNVWPNPTCSKLAPASKAARNSKTWPGSSSGSGPTRAPSTVSRPAAAVAVPPVAQGVTVQSKGTVPSSEWVPVGASASVPSSSTQVSAPGAPALKSATESSTNEDAAMAAAGAIASATRAATLAAMNRPDRKRGASVSCASTRLTCQRSP
jgi:hypothetical protein